MTEAAILDAPNAPTPLVTSPALVVENLSKTYRTGFWLNRKVQSLKGVSLTAHQGETFGLLGPNGAGKTTLLKSILGIVRPSGGSGTILGHPLGDREIRKRIGYLPENPYFYEYLTGWEVLEFSASLFQISKADARKRIVELLDWVGLSQQAARKKQLRQYSKGMLQRVGVAQALINNPDVVFLDEPMSGLDPLGRYQIREIILSLKSQGKTIFFNSHVLSDVEKVCDRLAILARGELLCMGTIDDLLGKAEQYQVRGQGGNTEILSQWVESLTFDDQYWQGLLKGEPQEFLGSLRLMGAQLLSLNLYRPSLEQFFVEELRQRNIQPSE
ncbi:MAG: ABC transporter ATP-binding protein [Prochlorotrichaceae cyanobacterium]|jgi:ABC-2 type transport system ATP-binding protein